MSTQSADKTPTNAIIKPLASEEILSEKWDLCLSSLIVKSSIGAAAGIAFGVLVFRRRAWPAWVGLGIGAGRAWEGCEREFKAGPEKIGNYGGRIVRN
ncbi:DUF543-domain-containing protein [Ascobolus immersus RN42]|uniref:MICOS complex subunit MIC10 n=1 Tax=Ascobolus immersus RN42 TaxID=1160509 RepID=A0A3N4I3L0_ASCIM|nr:DUF543-domain-containing protein [Ascobolus immersus RN42]